MASHQATNGTTNGLHAGDASGRPGDGKDLVRQVDGHHCVDFRNAWAREVREGEKNHRRFSDSHLSH